MQPYEALAAVYDEWTAASEHERWARFADHRFRRDGAHRVLDVCCGSGRMTAALQRLGYTVEGIDGSAAMLERAAARVSPGTPLHHMVLPGPPLAPGDFDAAVCCFDSVNYFVDEGLPGLLSFVAGSLRPGASFVFDVNTPHKLRDVFANSHYGDDVGEFAYVWRNRMDPQRRLVRFLITLFTRAGDCFARAEEEHVQQWFSNDELHGAATASGFEVVEVVDDYGEAAPGPTSLRQTWVLRRA